MEEVPLTTTNRSKRRPPGLSGPLVGLLLGAASVGAGPPARGDAPRPWPPIAGASPDALDRLARRARTDRGLRCALDVLGPRDTTMSGERPAEAVTGSGPRWPVRHWLACAGPVGMRPGGAPALGAPCVEGSSGRWQPLEAGADGLVWLSDLTGPAPSQIHLAGTVPGDTRRIALRGAAERVEVLIAGAEPSRGTRVAFGPVEKAAAGQYEVRLEDGSGRPGGEAPSGLTLLVRLTPTPHTAVRFGLSADTVPLEPAALITPERWRAMVAGFEGPAGAPSTGIECRPGSAPALALAVDRALGRPDGPLLLEDALLASGVATRDLDATLLALPEVRRLEAREAIVAHLGQGEAADAELRHALAALALDGGHVARAVLFLGAKGWDPRHDALAARVALARGRPEDAVALLARCRTGTPCDTATRALLAEALEALGLRSEAEGSWAPRRPGARPSVEELVAAATAHPSRARLSIEAGRRLAEGGRSAEGLDLLRPLAAHGGYDARVIATETRIALAEALEALGEIGDARALAEETLADAPNDPDAVALVERLSGEAWTPPLTAWAEAFGPLGPEAVGALASSEATLAEAASKAPLNPLAAWEVLEEHTFVDVAPDGSARRLGRRLLRAGPTGQGIRAPLRWPWDPSRVDLRLLKADLLPGGDPTARRPLRGRRVEAGETTLGLYAEERVLVVPVDAVRPGDLVELLWRITPTGERFPGYVEVALPLTDVLSRHQGRTWVRLPAGLEAAWRVSADPLGAARIDTATRVAGGARFVTVAVGPSPGIPAEPWAPPAAELSATFTLAGGGDWPSLARFYADVLRGEQVMTPAMRARVAEVVAAHRRADGAPDERAIAEAIAEEVATRIRYVGLEFGIHGYRPYRTDDVWARRYGDCKDQALLLVALLGEAGIAADPVLVRTRHLGDLPGPDADVLPLLAHFDHAIVYLRDADRFIDVTAPHHGLATLPAADQGGHALRVPLDGTPSGPLRRLPFSGPTMSGASGDFTVIIEPSGRAVVQGRVRYRGVQAGTWRARLSDAAAREQRVQMMIATTFPGFRLGHAAVDGVSFGENLVTVSFDGEVPRLAVPGADGRLVLDHPLPLGGQRRRIGEAGGRRLPFVLGPPSAGTFEIAWTFPADTRVTPPAPFRVSQAGVDGAVDWTVSDGAGPLTVTGRVELRFLEERIPASELSAFAEALGAFDAAVGAPLTATMPMDMQ